MPFFVAQQPKLGIGRLVVEVSRLQADTRTHARTQARARAHARARAVTLLWTTDQLVAEAASPTTNTKDEHPCLQRDSNPTLPAIERLQTYAIERTVTWIGYVPLYKFTLFTFALITQIAIFYRI